MFVMLSAWVKLLVWCMGEEVVVSVEEEASWPAICDQLRQPHALVPVAHHTRDICDRQPVIPNYSVFLREVKFPFFVINAM